MPRNARREEHRPLIRAGKIIADGLMRTTGVRRSEALERAAATLGHPDWNRLTGHARNHEDPGAMLDAPRKALTGSGHVLLSGSEGEISMALAPTIIMASELSPTSAILIVPFRTGEQVEDAFRLMSGPRADGRSIIALSPGPDQDAHHLCSAIFSVGPARFSEIFGACVRVWRGSPEIIGPDAFVHVSVLCSIPGKRLPVLGEDGPS